MMKRIKTHNLIDGRWLGAILLLAVLCCSCAGHSARPVDTVQDETVPAASSGGISDGQLTAFPSDPYVDPAEIATRRGSVYQAVELSGLEYDLCSAGTMPGPLSLLLVPGEESLAWAAYSFDDNLVEDTRLLLAIELTPILPQSMYVAIADYAKNAWHWLSIDTPQTGNYLGFPEGMQPISPGGRIHVIVLVESGDSASVAGLTLHRDVIAPPPAGLSADMLSPLPDRIVLGWDDPAVTYSGLVYDAIRLERRLGAESAWQEIELLPPGSTEYHDLHTAWNELPYGQSINYRLSTVAGNTTGQPCPVVTGMRWLNNMTGVEASDGEFPDRVRITWDEVPGAESYVLEGSSCGTSSGWLPLYQGPGTQYDHFWNEVPQYPIDFGEWEGYYYRVKASWEETETPWDYDDGYRDLPEVPNVQASDGTYPDRNVITWDPIPGATGYVIWYYDHLGGIPEWPWFMDFVEGGGTTSYAHLPGIPGLPECYYNHVYTYGVTGQWNGDYSDDWSLVPTDDGYRLLQPPEALSASDDAYPDKITLAWQKTNSATGYLIYRDGMTSADLVATVGDTGTWDDTGVSDFEPHAYWIKSLWMEFVSEFSESDSGSRNRFRVHSTGISGNREIELTVIDGIPAIATVGMVDEIIGTYYSRSLVETPTGSSDWATHRIAELGSGGSSCTLAEVNGKPGVAYRDGLTDDVFYAYASSATPSQPADWQNILVTNSFAYYKGLDLAEVDGRPAIGIGADNLIYAYADVPEPTGSENWNQVLFSSTFLSNLDVLARNNLPVIMFGLHPYFAESATSSPVTESDWTISGCGMLSLEISMALNGDLPVISYSEEPKWALRFGQTATPSPTGPGDWINHEVYCSEDKRCEDNCIGVVGGKPAICFMLHGADYPYTGNDECDAVMFALAKIAEPIIYTDWEFTTIASSDRFYNFEGLSMVIHDDTPLICFSDEDRGSVQFAAWQD